MKSGFKKLKSALVGGLPQICLQEEVQPYLAHLKNLVLNAGAGHRPVITGHPTLSLDFDETAPVDCLADLHYLPLRDACVDSVLSVAVLEHTRWPWECAREIQRVLKPGGTAVICVPFLQPEHAVPHDFFRYTVFGLRSMLEWAGFEVQSVERIGRQHRALAWMLLEMRQTQNRIARLCTAALATCIARRAKTGPYPPLSLYTGSYAVARKPGQASPGAPVDTSARDWFYPLLVDPVAKTPLQKSGDSFRSPEGEFYQITNGVPDLRPKHGLAQDARQAWAKPRPGSCVH